MNKNEKLEMIKFLLDLSDKLISVNNVVLDFLADIYEDIVFEGVTEDESKC